MRNETEIDILTDILKMEIEKYGLDAVGASCLNIYPRGRGVTSSMKIRIQSVYQKSFDARTILQEFDKLKTEQ